MPLECLTVGSFGGSCRRHRWYDSHGDVEIVDIDRQHPAARACLVMTVSYLSQQLQNASTENGECNETQSQAEEDVLGCEWY